MYVSNPYVSIQNYLWHCLYVCEYVCVCVCVCVGVHVCVLCVCMCVCVHVTITIAINTAVNTSTVAVLIFLPFNQMSVMLKTSSKSPQNHPVRICNSFMTHTH